MTTPSSPEMFPLALPAFLANWVPSPAAALQGVMLAAWTVVWWIIEINVILVWFAALAALGLVYLWRHEWPPVLTAVALGLATFIMFFYIHPLAFEYRVAKLEQMYKIKDYTNKCRMDTVYSRDWSEWCLKKKHEELRSPFNEAFAHINRETWQQISDFFYISWSAALALLFGGTLLLVGYCVVAPASTQLVAYRNQALRDQFTQSLYEKAITLGLRSPPLKTD